ncbi:unnamed protein product [Rhodiola kirilowii]
MATHIRRLNRLTSRLFSLTRLQRLCHSEVSNHELLGMPNEAEAYREMSSKGEIDKSKWKEVDSRAIGITRSMIPESAFTVLKTLQSEGFEAYLVGGCVRDLTLDRIPKDFDVVTTANLKQIRKQFYNSVIVGQRFPICLVKIKNSVVEVSTFDTRLKISKEQKKLIDSQTPEETDVKDSVRWKDSLRRDFTINSLFYDPIQNRVFDYVGGIRDLKSLELKTVIPASLSFKEDCARIVRGLRIAARLNLNLSADTENAMRSLSSSVKSLAKPRLMMEMNYMLSYGAAEASFCLLQKSNLLEVFFPFHAVLLDHYASKGPFYSSIMLARLLSNLDRIVIAGQPIHCSLWIALLAFHQQLIINPQDTLVVLTFSSVLYSGNWNQGLQFARECTHKPVNFSPEIKHHKPVILTDEELADIVTRFASLVQSSIDIFTDRDTLNKSLARLPFPTSQGMVFISKKMGRAAAKILDALVLDIKSYDAGRLHFGIDHDKLKTGDPCETQFSLGKIILDSLSGGVDCGISKYISDHVSDTNKSKQGKIPSISNHVTKKKVVDAKKTAHNEIKDSKISDQDKMKHVTGSRSKNGEDSSISNKERKKQVSDSKRNEHRDNPPTSSKEQKKQVPGTLESGHGEDSSTSNQEVKKRKLLNKYPEQPKDWVNKQISRHCSEHTSRKTGSDKNTEVSLTISYKHQGKTKCDDISQSQDSNRKHQNVQKTDIDVKSEHKASLCVEEKQSMGPSDNDQQKNAMGNLGEKFSFQEPKEEVKQINDVTHGTLSLSSLFA